MGEAGGRGTGVQHQALQPPSVRTLPHSHTRAPVRTGRRLPFLPAKINMGPRGCLLGAEARVGSGAPREPFISLTVKVGREDEGEI